MGSKKHYSRMDGGIGMNFSTAILAIILGYVLGFIHGMVDMAKHCRDNFDDEEGD